MQLSKRIPMHLLLTLTLFVIAGSPLSAFAAGEQRAKLKTISSDVQAVLDDIQQQLSQTAATLANTGLQGPQTQEAVQKLCEMRPFFSSCVALNTEGIVTEVFPTRFHDIQGKNVSDQEHIARMLTKREPVMSALFKAVEGFHAVEFGAPVLDKRGKLMGAVSVIVKPYHFLKGIISPLFSWDALSIWVMEPGSTALFSKDRKLVGRDLKKEAVTSHQFEYVPLLLKIEKQESGSEHFLRRGKGRSAPIPRQLDWNSVHFRDGRWRVVLVGPTT